MVEISECLYNDGEEVDVVGPQNVFHGWVCRIAHSSLVVVVQTGAGGRGERGVRACSLNASRDASEPRGNRRRDLFSRSTLRLGASSEPECIFCTR